MVLWRVLSTANIGKGTPWVEGLHGWQAPRTNASRVIVTRIESRTKYGTWYHIPYCHEYVAISLHNNAEIVLHRFPAVDIADTISKRLWFKKKKKKKVRRAKRISNVESSVYLDVSLTASGVTEGKHIMRVKSVQRRLMQLSPIGIHIRGFDTNLSVMLYRVFVRSIYEYCLHLVPLTLSLKLAISRLESCFFRLVLGKVASGFGSSRLPRLRSLCRLESVDLRRIIMGQQRLSYYQDRRRAA